MGMNLESAKPSPFWWDSVTAMRTRPPVAGDLDVDVVIIGAGFTGLWCAYHLAGLVPDASIVVVEAEHVGFGASGRNGGWCHAEYPLGHSTLVRDHGREAALRHMRALFESVDDVGAITASEGIDCDFHKGGVVFVARKAFQDDQARHEVIEAHEFGLDEGDIRYLPRLEARAMLSATGVLGGLYWAHGAAIQPAKLVHGLAGAAEGRGVRIHEGSRVLAIDEGSVVTRAGRIRAPMVVRATEGFTSQLPDASRTAVPLYSMMIATEPLSGTLWDSIGLADRQTFGDFRNLIIYGQRTADGRLAFGGRGAPYHFGSRIDPAFDLDDGVHRELVRSLLELFPQLEDVEISHRWGGPLGVSRDWRPSVTIDRANGFAFAGGYVGDGVATAQMAGRTLAELIAEIETERTGLPWVNHEWPRWEPEPLRWIGINAGLRMAAAADRSEDRTDAPSKLADLGNWLRGKR